jgi:hypothetical protein
MTRTEIDAVNTAASALGLGLAGMTWDRWRSLSAADKDRLRDRTGLTAQLIGYEFCRVEVVTESGECRRFWVGTSSGWRPCHIEIKRLDALGGEPAERSYKSVRLIKKSNRVWIELYNPRRMK